MTIAYVLIALLITLPITGIGYYSSKNMPGALLCLLIALPAWVLGRLLPVAGGPVIGILFGMLLAQLWRLPDNCKPGTKETGKRVLQTAIVLFGFQMNLAHVVDIGGQALALLLAVVAAALILAYFIGKHLGLSDNERTLIGVGTAICGGSAIAAAAPIIKADDKQVATAISIIFMFNVIAVFVFPAAGHLMGMDDTSFGIWAGAAINDTSSVVAAGFSYSESAGNTATVVKLTRTLLIIPITFALALRQSKLTQEGGGFSLRKTFPWFVAGFLAASILNTTGAIPAVATAFWGEMGRFLIVMAMVGIGLGVNFKELLRHGKKPILLGFCLSLAVASVSLIMIFF
ncbi:MAG: YeiH family protein [Defluviitaleaceae bacterium]|nr:YeiH family protein [Defluviitaleaceae bacterium]